mmetsp:Transcript_9947/g.37090  ORF Transcript_9947/g.37090 Transcript_9947/m.37090 type:complete len:342 (-) Transcript_9947:1588-2613(-)
MKFPAVFKKIPSNRLYYEAGMSPGVLNDLMRRLENVYTETGGNITSEIELVKGLHPFEAHKIVIASKISATRDKLKRLEEAYHQKRGLRIEAKLSVQVRQMIENIKEERKKMMDLHQKNVKNARRRRQFNLVRRRAVSPEELLQQERDLNLITRHVVELEETARQRYRRRATYSSERNALLHRDPAILEEIPQQEDDSHMRSIRQQMLLRDEVFDAEHSHLPELDISASLQKVRQHDEELDEYLDAFNEKIQRLHQQTTTIGTELDEQNILVETINDKSENAKERVARLNARLEKSLRSVNSQQKLCCMVCLLCIMLVFVGFALGFIINAGRFGIDIPQVG